MEAAEGTVSVLTWNVLAHCYMLKAPPAHLAPKEMQRDRRRAALARVLREVQADVCCLQEVDDFPSHWDAAFAKLGYGRTWDCRLTKKEGLCMLVRTETIELVSMQRLELDETAKLVEHGSRGHHQRHSLAQVAHLRRRDTGVEFLVANTHLFWNPAATDVKIFQAHYLATRISELNVRRLPVVLCGDFNSLPNSAVLQLLRSGALQSSHPEYVKYCAAKHSAFDFSIPIRFDVKPCGCFTNYVGHFKGCIDYVALHGCALVSQTVVGATGEFDYAIVAREDFENTGGNDGGGPSVYPLLPSLEWPSDHLALLAVVSIKHVF